jgi:hypothetical protein
MIVSYLLSQNSNIRHYDFASETPLFKLLNPIAKGKQGKVAAVGYDSKECARKR